VKSETLFRPLSSGMDSSERLAFLGLSFVEFLSPKEKHKLIKEFGSAARIFEHSRADLSSALCRKMITDQWVPDRLLSQARDMERLLTGGSLGCIFYGDSTYPPQLREIFDPPVTLFHRGTLPENGHTLAGIVGTRFPTGGARRAAYRLGFELALEGVGVVSGLARGIDRESHEGCVEAGGYSIAVLGSGIDRMYPESSREAGQRILKAGGAILSEYPPGTPPLHWHFPARNRIISGLCRSVAVVQAPERSGALITAEYALDQGRDLYVHAAGLAGTAGAGTRRLSESGAPVIRGAYDIMRDWGREPRQTGPSEAPASERAGARLARLLKDEMEGSCTVKGGEIYWRQ